MSKLKMITGHDPVTKRKRTLEVDSLNIIAEDTETGEVIGSRNTPGRFWVGDVLLLLNANSNPDNVPDVAPEPPREPHFLYLG